ncbi:MAG: sigma-70 family RNA polymerase sigma factor [Bacteroidetes bacterium]|nr:sigma-70 family RNA polymerase sigma factor [Bacteroidota bacterium]MBS1609344.1 sigma-70 family RNA polymerase sigma factor [Bacteroidota bacterium]
MSAKTAHIDSSYWARLKKGDPLALGYFYDNYADKVFISALRMTPDRELAKDALQEVFIEIWNYRNTLGDVMHTQSYLIKVMRSILLKKLKKESQYSPYAVPETLASSENSIEEIIISSDIDKEKKHRLRAALSNLTNRQKQVLEMRFNEGLSYEQIADKLSMNYQSVNNLAFRTIHRLRSQLLSVIIGFISLLLY